jgi:hypothetical protein
MFAKTLPNVLERGKKDCQSALDFPNSCLTTRQVVDSLRFSVHWQFLNEVTFQFPEGIVRASLGLPNPAATSSLNASVPTGFVVVPPDACTSTGAGHLG